MNRNRIVILSLLCILLSPASGEGYASTVYLSKDSVSVNLNEKLCLFTDRNLYVAGEKILFSAVIYNSPSLGEYEWSKVLYLELISPDGNAVMQTKHPVSDFKSDGYLQLPENMLTGNYLMKAYTRWMQNFSPLSYAWLHVKVVNPFQEAIATADDANADKDGAGIIPADIGVSGVRISCKTDKALYGQREKVILDLAVPPGHDHLPGRYCITVVRPDAIDTMNYGSYGPMVDRNTGNFALKYVPDIRGLSLSGKVVEKVSRNGVSQAHARLSVLGKNADYSSYITRNDGSFLFALEPYDGTTDMYVSVDPKEDLSLEILVDNEYANDNLVFFTRPFGLSIQEKDIATGMMLNFQIEKSYLRSVQDTSGSADERGREFFYGRPSNTIYIDDFIELPTIGEVIFELVPDVYFIRRNDIYFLRSRSYISDLEIYKPLVMIDDIPVPDIGAMLKMSPERIERIDVVDKLYAKGDLLFGGIMNLISRKGDMAGIDLPKNSYFFSFDGFVPPDTAKFYRIQNQDLHTRIPDVRNCLYWNPSAIIPPGRTVRVEFNTSDITGNYLIVVRGVTQEGTIIEGNSAFSVESTY